MTPSCPSLVWGIRHRLWRSTRPPITESVLVCLNHYPDRRLVYLPFFLLGPWSRRFGASRKIFRLGYYRGRLNFRERSISGSTDGGVGGPGVPFHVGGKVHRVLGGND